MNKRSVRWAAVPVFLVALLASLPASAAPSWQAPGEASIAERLFGFFERLVPWSSDEPENEDPPEAGPVDDGQAAEVDPSTDSDLGPEMDPDG